MTHYYAGRSGDPISEALVHTDRDCPDIDEESGGIRPIADATVEALADVTLCGACSGADVGAETLISEGVCPWCDGYSGDHVGQHASSAHAERWRAFKGED